MMRNLFVCLLFSLLSPVFLNAQSIAVKGKVVDGDTGMPIPGVNILVKGTSNGTASDFDGNYSIEVERNSTLVFSYIGFVTQEIKVGTQSTIDVVLKPELAELDDVVVVGYTSKKKSDITSSVSTVESKDLTDVTSPNVSNLLQGKASGVQISQGSGQPGSGAAIRIRGITSLGGNSNPLWVVDGVIMHGVPNINPNEIKSISVLKDASATALYGSRGANGVIQVETKSGDKGKTTFSVSSKVGFSKFNNGNFRLMNSAEMYDYYKSFGNQNSIPKEVLDTENLASTNFDWFDNATQTGVVQDHNITLVGGNKNSKVFTSLGYYKETGTVKGYSYDRVSYRLNYDYDINERFTIRPKFSIIYRKNSDNQHSLYAMYTYMPWDLPYDEKGNVIDPQKPGVKWYGRDKSNYLYDLQFNYGKGRTFDLLTNFDFQYDILPNFKYISTNSITLYYSDSFSYTDPKSNGGKANRGILDKSVAKRYTNFTNQMLKYNLSVGGHTLNALLAYEYNDYKYEDVGAKGYGIISGSKILDNTTKPAETRGKANDYALQSFLFNTDYSYDSKYVAQFSIRRDGASNFGLDNQYGTFFSGSFGWNVHNESFFKIKEINELKLRLSYGGLGNRPSSLYPQYELYTLSGYNGISALVPSQLGNSDLKWEKSYQTNLGVDIGFMNKINLSLEYYIKDTSDLLYYVTLPAVSGYTGYWENVGGVKNIGFESTLNWQILKNKNDFNWDVSFNFGVNRNEITDVYKGKDIDRGTKISKIGEDYNAWYMPKWAGVNPENGDPQWEIVDPDTGEVTLTSNYNKATKQIVGTSSPDFYGGFSTSLSYGQFYMSSNFAFSKGGLIYNRSRELYDADGAYPTYNQVTLKNGWSRWQQKGDNATHPRPMYGGNNLSNKTSSRYLEDGSYLRMRNIRFGYTLPENICKKIRISALDIFISGDNLLTITNYSGSDPEVEINGYSNSQYPVSKRYTFGVNISF